MSYYFFLYAHIKIQLQRDRRQSLSEERVHILVNQKKKYNESKRSHDCDLEYNQASRGRGLNKSG